MVGTCNIIFFTNVLIHITTVGKYIINEKSSVYFDVLLKPIQIDVINSISVLKGNNKNILILHFFKRYTMLYVFTPYLLHFISVYFVCFLVTKIASYKRNNYR